MGEVKPNEEEESNAFLQLAECELKVDAIEKDVAQYRLDKMKSVYQERDGLVNKIPEFWKIVLSQHTDFANYIRASDFTYVDCIQDVKVEWDNVDEFKIIIKFDGIKDDFEAQTVTKQFKRQKIIDDTKSKEDSDSDDDDDELEKLISEPVDIKWPKKYEDICPESIQDKKSPEGKKKYRQGMKSLFGWFRWTGLKPGKEFPHGDSFAELIVDDLYPYCVKYYTEAHRDLEDENDDSDSESEGELDLSDDEGNENEPKRRKL
ncbi:hypothetical protein Kpol_2000p29 [Vanderwaltozyma polyspora DSM 70294]|uniref:Vacuolar protein sorting-associated protein 75 n=1 Tax=Vanderwaltozyma polyspora (strain ATCC 22028 / DSM 70294 / BCRC 21397 / CBS 2163 / NBRC 10782 / NRRL Y-8283 / UCD 57-17) TaxID=436907 RepID=A7TF39_VANPO|nr:uncharacterized protein Kpol_2000p29 [Vanderwaltozyma polyspora DSM 70294]EDO19064.1 hypothetical protein Kpol_2000p29 [Vanderwaltozyma polyspora DSM 70294]